MFVQQIGLIFFLFQLQNGMRSPHRQPSGPCAGLSSLTRNTVFLGVNPGQKICEVMYCYLTFEQSSLNSTAGQPETPTSHMFQYFCSLKQCCGVIQMVINPKLFNISRFKYQ